MNRKIAGLLATFLMLTGPLALAEAGTITITIKNITAVEGRLFVGLFRPADAFPRQDHAFQGVTLPVDQVVIETRLTDIPEGTYAVAVFHDANGNGDHDRNFWGIPREDYGFSNDARGSFGPPAFEKAAFEHTGNTRITIHLKP